MSNSILNQNSLIFRRVIRVTVATRVTVGSVDVATVTVAGVFHELGHFLVFAAKRVGGYLFHFLEHPVYVIQSMIVEIIREY